MKIKWGVIINDTGLVTPGISYGHYFNGNKAWSLVLAVGLILFFIGLYKIGEDA